MEERKQVVIKQLLTSRASSTVKRYFGNKKVLLLVAWIWVEVQLPFDCVTIAIYLSKCFHIQAKTNDRKV